MNVSRIFDTMYPSTAAHLEQVTTSESWQAASDLERARIVAAVSEVAGEITLKAYSVADA